MKSRSNYVSNSSSTSFVLKTAVVKSKTFEETMDNELNRHLSICLKCIKFMRNLRRCAETPFCFENNKIPFEQRNVPRSCEFYAEQFVFDLENHESNVQ